MRKTELDQSYRKDRRIYFWKLCSLMEGLDLDQLGGAEGMHTCK